MKKNPESIQVSIKEVNSIRLVIVASMAFITLDLVLVFSSYISLLNLFLAIPAVEIIRIQWRNHMIARSVMNLKKYILDPEFKKKYDLRRKAKKKA